MPHKKKHDNPIEGDDQDHLPDKNNNDGGHVHGPGCGCGREGTAHDHRTHGYHPPENDRPLPGFPAEITFKAVFRNRPYVKETLKSLCAESGIDSAISDRESRNGTFISYTITGVFPSEELLNSLCSRIGLLEGFYTMF